jgi:hypothetical protein
MSPPLKLSLDEIRREAHEEVAFLEDTITKYPDWKWPREMLVLSREFEALVSVDSIDIGRARNFTSRMRAHISKERLKGMDATIWRAEALEDILHKIENT